MAVTAANYFQTSDNARIYFEDVNPGSVGDPIVLLHGFLCCSKFWEKNVAALSENHRLVMIDWRGHGRSGITTSNLTMHRCAEDLKELLDHLDLWNVTLLTHSMSSSINCEYYQSFGPYRLKKTVICDSNLFPFAPDSWNTHQLRGYNMDRVSQLANFSREDFFAYCDAFAGVLCKQRPAQEIVEYFAAEMKRIPPWMAFCLYSDFAVNDYTQVLPHIVIPLLICGADSPALTNGIECAKYYQSLAPHAEVYAFRNSGHMMFYEEPEVFNRVVLAFVEK